jgi:hypothetical protein
MRALCTSAMYQKSCRCRRCGERFAGCAEALRDGRKEAVRAAHEAADQR